MKNCSIRSQIISVDSINDIKSTYDLLVSASTKDQCNMTCELEDKIHGKAVESYEFSDRNYYFYKFENLIQFREYQYTCYITNNNLRPDNPEFSSILFPKSESITKIAAFGDWSICEDGKKTHKFLSDNYINYDALVMLGDLAYNLFTDAGKVGNDFLEFIAPITKKLPFQTVSGNHENFNNYSDFINRFNMPMKKQNNNLYFSFDINNSHFVAVPSDFPLDEEKMPLAEIAKFLEWLETDLSKTTKKWKIVYMHRPLYCSWNAPRCTIEAVKIRNFYEKIFMKYKIDLIIQGHLHNYERMFPIFNGKIDEDSISNDRNTYTNPKYPTYLICGSAGNEEGHTPNCKYIINLIYF